MSIEQGRYFCSGEQLSVSAGALRTQFGIPICIFLRNEHFGRIMKVQYRLTCLISLQRNLILPCKVL